MYPSAKCGIYGYEPQMWPHRMPKAFECRNNVELSRACFKDKFKEELPHWWPMHDNGVLVTHLYRLICESRGTDLVFPAVTERMARKLQKDEDVDFRDKDVILQALCHVDKISEGNLAERPFLSWSKSQAALIPFGIGKMAFAKDRGRLNEYVQYVRLDLYALFQHGRFSEEIFADLTNENKFNSFFKPTVTWDFLDRKGIFYESCLQASGRLNEFLLGCRGRWWVDYSVLISDVGAVHDNQTGGYNGTVFGTSLKAVYENLHARDYPPPKPPPIDCPVRRVAFSSPARPASPAPAPPPPMPNRDVPRGMTSIHAAAPSSSLSLPAAAISHNPQPNRPGEPSTPPVLRQFDPFPAPGVSPPPAMWRGSCAPIQSHKASIPTAVLAGLRLPEVPADEASIAAAAVSSPPAPPDAAISHNQQLKHSGEPPLPPTLLSHNQQPKHPGAPPLPAALRPDPSPAPVVSPGPPMSCGSTEPFQSRQPSSPTAVLPGLTPSEAAEASYFPDESPDWEDPVPEPQLQPFIATELPPDPVPERKGFLEDMETVWALMADENAAKVLNGTLLNLSGIQRAMSHNGNPAKLLAVIVHQLMQEHNQACMRASCETAIFLRRIPLEKAMALEKAHAGWKRKYREDLRVTGLYHAYKRSAMQDVGYSEEQLSRNYEVPKQSDQKEELLERLKQNSALTGKLFRLCRTSKDNFDGLTDADKNVTLLLRLVYLPPSVVGGRGAHVIRNLVSHWGAVRDSERSASGGYKPQCVDLGGTFAQLMHRKGYIIIADRRWEVETQSPDTINIPSNYPEEAMRTLVWFAHEFGFSTVTDTDRDGKNIFHHLFTMVKCSTLAGEIALTCFGPNAEKLPGDYTAAMSHTVTSGTPKGWTPLHVLCSGSDVLLVNVDIMQQLMDNRIVSVRDFDSTRNTEVSVFCFLLGPHGLL